MILRRSALALVVSFAFLAAASGQQPTPVPGSPAATTTIDGKQLPPPDPTFGGVIKDNALAVEAVVGAARRAAEGRAERPAHHDRRRRLRRHRARSAASSRRPPSTASRRPGCATRRFHSTALCSPTRAALITGRNHHSAGFGVISEQSTGYPGLRQHHREGQGHDRPDPQGQRLRHLLVRQGPQHADLRGQPGRAVRPVADRHGLRVLLRIRRRRHQPVGAEPVPQHDADLPLRRQSGMEPDDRHGRRRHRNGSTTSTRSTRRSRSSATTSPAARMRRITRRPSGSRRFSDMHLFDKGWNELRDTDLRQPEEARRHPAGREADAVAERAPQATGTQLTPDEKKMFIRQVDVYRRLPRLHRLRDRPRHPGGRGHGQARQHAHHLHQRRQRLERRGHARSARRTRSRSSTASRCRSRTS